jgi:hypothetical protein
MIIPQDDYASSPSQWDKIEKNYMVYACIIN